MQIGNRCQILILWPAQVESLTKMIDLGIFEFTNAVKSLFLDNVKIERWFADTGGLVTYTWILHFSMPFSISTFFFFNFSIPLVKLLSSRLLSFLLCRFIYQFFSLSLFSPAYLFWLGLRMKCFPSNTWHMKLKRSTWYR